MKKVVLMLLLLALFTSSCSTAEPASGFENISGNLTMTGLKGDTGEQGIQGVQGEAGNCTEAIEAHVALSDPHNQYLKESGNESISCQLTRTTALVVPNDTYQIFTWDKVVFDSSAFFNPTYPTHVYIPENGVYLICFYCNWAGDATGDRQISIFWNETSSIILAGIAPNGTIPVSPVINGVFYFNSGDHFEVYAYQNAGHNLNILFYPWSPFLSVVKLR